jgi:hypothetical protein
MARLPRNLTKGELMVLDLVQEHYGPWNNAEEVFLSDQKEAVIFVKDASGDCPIIVNLTVCAMVYEQGDLTLEELKVNWLRIPDA